MGLYPQELPVTAHKETDVVLAVSPLGQGHVAAVLRERDSCQKKAEFRKGQRKVEQIDTVLKAMSRRERKTIGFVAWTGIRSRVLLLGSCYLKRTCARCVFMHSEVAASDLFASLGPLKASLVNPTLSSFRKGKAACEKGKQATQFPSAPVRVRTQHNMLSGSPQKPHTVSSHFHMTFSMG